MASEEGGATENAAATPEAAKQDNVYENRPGTKKIIRAVTVMAYMVSVSFVAMVLSGYYIFLWQPPNPRLLHRDHLRGDPRIEYLVNEQSSKLSHDETKESRPTDVREKVNLFREEILRARATSLSRVREKIGIDTRNETFNDTTTITIDPIIRALLDSGSSTTSGTREQPRTSNDVTTRVYENVDNATRNDLDISTPLFTKTSMINESFVLATPPHFSLSLRNEDKSSEAPIEDSTRRTVLGNPEDDGNFNRRYVTDNDASIVSTTLKHLEVFEATKNSYPSRNSTILENDRFATNETSELRVSPGDANDTMDEFKDEPEVEHRSIVVQPVQGGSHITRLPAMPLTMVNDTQDSQKSEENLSGQLSVDISQDSSKQDVETSTEPPGVGRLCPWTKLLKEVRKND